MFITLKKQYKAHYIFKSLIKWNNFVQLVCYILTLQSSICLLNNKKDLFSLWKHTFVFRLLHLLSCCLWSPVWKKRINDLIGCRNEKRLNPKLLWTFNEQKLWKREDLILKWVLVMGFIEICPSCFEISAICFTKGDFSYKSLLSVKAEVGWWSRTALYYFFTFGTSACLMLLPAVCGLNPLLSILQGTPNRLCAVKRVRSRLTFGAPQSCLSSHVMGRCG